MRRTSGSRWSSSAWRRSRSPSLRVTGSAGALSATGPASASTSRPQGCRGSRHARAGARARRVEGRGHGGARGGDRLAVGSGGLELRPRASPRTAAVDRAGGAPAARARRTVESIRKLCDDLHAAHAGGRADRRRRSARRRRLPGAGERPLLAARAAVARSRSAGRSLGRGLAASAAPAIGSARCWSPRARVARAPAPLQPTARPLHALLPARRPLLRARRPRGARLPVGRVRGWRRPRDHVRRLRDRARVPARGAAALRRRVAPPADRSRSRTTT